MQTEERTHLWLVMASYSFEDLFRSLLEEGVTMEAGDPVGFLPVFGSLEDAKAWVALMSPETAAQAEILEISDKGDATIGDLSGSTVEPQGSDESEPWPDY